MFQYKSPHWIKYPPLLVIAGLLLTACGGAKLAILGKWEVMSGSGVGTLYEFFEDGTVSVGGFAGQYSWPDQSHIKMEAGLPVVYTFELSGDQLSLTDAASQTVLVLKKYREFSPDMQILSSPWQRSYPDNSSCFKGLGIDMTPQEIILGTDGTIVLNDNVNLGIVGSGLTMNGQYVIHGNGLHVSASGMQANSGILGLGASQTAVQGEFDCTITISNSRLTFQHTQGQSTVFVREEN